MNTIRLMIPALMAAGAIACFAEPAAESSPNAAKPVAAKLEDGPRRPRLEQRREGRPSRPEGESRRRDMWIGEGLDGLAGQSMMLRMLERPEAAARLGIQPDVRDKILASFKTIDDDIAAKRAALAELQRHQAKLMAERAAKEAVMEAVDKVWKCRGEIAKLQTAKVIELQSHLTDEQIKKIDAVRAEEFRTRRMRQLRDGETPSGREGGPRGKDAPAKPEVSAKPERAKAPEGK